MTSRTICSLALLSGVLLLPIPAFAATYSTGTGFFISRYGQVVTNAHVLDQCVSTRIRTIAGRFYPVTVEAFDPVLDLALLSSPFKPSRPARLRHRYTGVKTKEKVVVMGFPEDAAREGRYEIAYSTVRGLEGMRGESHWLQFEDSARMGNSGGPLLDYAGNVVGVVTGKATLTRYNAIAARDETIGQSDFAINLEALRGFLQEHRVIFESRDSLMKLSPRRIEDVGKDFIVTVLCEQS